MDKMKEPSIEKRDIKRYENNRLYDGMFNVILGGWVFKGTFNRAEVYQKMGKWEIFVGKGYLEGRKYWWRYQNFFSERCNDTGYSVVQQTTKRWRNLQLGSLIYWYEYSLEICLKMILGVLEIHRDSF